LSLAFLPSLRPDAPAAESRPEDLACLDASYFFSEFAALRAMGEAGLKDIRAATARQATDDDFEFFLHILVR
jgi:hypothetical protein